ncbi:MAG: hypothetical protein KDC80_17015 [Saprospiraceae bacterium]|nr:hypothetical protein [Saprospiraceae bacterium]
MKTQILTMLLLCVISNFLFAQESRLLLETNASDGIGRNQLDLINTSDSDRSASVQRFITGTTTNQVESGFRNFPFSYTGVDDYGGYFSISNNASGIIFRNETSNGDFRFLIGGFPILTNQKMILDRDGNLGVGAIDPASRLQVKGGDIYLEDVGTGVIMKSPNGTCWRMTVNDSGNPVFTELMSCP